METAQYPTQPFPASASYDSPVSSRSFRLHPSTEQGIRAAAEQLDLTPEQQSSSYFGGFSLNNGSSYNYAHQPYDTPWTTEAALSPTQLPPLTPSNDHESYFPHHVQSAVQPTTSYFNNASYFEANNGRSTSLPGFPAHNMTPYRQGLMPSAQLDPTESAAERNFSFKDYLSDPIEDPEDEQPCVSSEPRSVPAAGLGISDSNPGSPFSHPADPRAFRDFSPYVSSVGTPSSGSDFDGQFDMDEDLQRGSRASSFSGNVNASGQSPNAAHAFYRASLLASPAYAMSSNPAQRPIYPRSPSSSSSISNLGGEMAHLDVLSSSASSESSFGCHEASSMPESSAFEYYRNMQQHPATSRPIQPITNVTTFPPISRGFGSPHYHVEDEQPQFAANLFGPIPVGKFPPPANWVDSSGHERQSTLTQSDVASTRSRQATVRGSIKQAFGLLPSASNSTPDLSTIGRSTRVEETSQGTLKGTRRPMDGKNPTTVGAFSPIDDTTAFHLMSTKRSRGRKPRGEQELGIQIEGPIDPNMSPTREQVNFVGVTKAGRPKKLFMYVFDTLLLIQC